jgi:hypothetical protein
VQRLLSLVAGVAVGSSRIKHRIKRDWLKLYDKARLVMRIETAINNPAALNCIRAPCRNRRPPVELRAAGTQ